MKSRIQCRKIILAQAQHLRRLLLNKFSLTTGKCNLASHTLSEVLTKLQFNPRIIFGSVFLPSNLEMPHVWLEIGSNILDITADQFNTYLDSNEQFPEIVYLPIKNLSRFIKKRSMSFLERRNLTTLEREFVEALSFNQARILP